MMDIDSLLNKYFEGETTLEEEHTLRAYFNQEKIPEHLKEVAPIFKYIEDEQAALEALKEIRDSSSTLTGIKKRKLILRRSFYISTVAAACITAVFFLFSPGESDPNGSDSYAWINGKRVTNKQEIMMFAEKSLENVSSSENIFMEQMNTIFEENIGEE